MHGCVSPGVTLTGSLPATALIFSCTQACSPPAGTCSGGSGGVSGGATAGRCGAADLGMPGAQPATVLPGGRTAGKRIFTPHFIRLKPLMESASQRRGVAHLQVYSAEVSASGWHLQALTCDSCLPSAVSSF